MRSNLRTNIVLALFGVVVGGVFALGGAWVILRPKAGSSFESLSDLRHAMLAEDPEQTPSGVTLRGILNPHPDDKIIFDLRPNLDVTFQSVSVKTNSCGMRSPERPIAKAPGTYRIALLGDSFTFGWGVEQKYSFAQTLEDNLNARSGGERRFEVLNFGVPGYSTFQEVAKFKEVGLDFEPDAVLVYFIENDFGLPFYVKDINNPGSMIPSTVFARLGWQNPDEKLAQQRAELYGYDANRALAELVEITRERGMKLFFAVNARKAWKADLRRMSSARAKNGVTVIPMWPDLMHVIDVRGLTAKELQLPTDPHPSAIKQRIFGEILTPYFMNEATG